MPSVSPDPAEKLLGPAFANPIIRQPSTLPSSLLGLALPPRACVGCRTVYGRKVLLPTTDDQEFSSFSSPS